MPNRRPPIKSANIVAHGFGPLVDATTCPYATYAACCNYSFNLESTFDLPHTELNETVGLAQGNPFRQQSTACL